MMTEQQDLVENFSSFSLPQLTRVIRKDWKNVKYSAVPYLNAMASIDSVDSEYGFDSGQSIVLYFLANASSWKGPIAKAVKLELKRRLKVR